MDDIFNSPGQCVNMMQDLGLKCEVDFCPTCGTMAGFCDLECGYGACASCGDCWRESAMSVGGTDRCDDGNSIDGDGCSSTCFVEPGFTCTKEQAGVGADTCEMCLDRENWTDAQGFTCEDYRTLDACDPGGSPADPVTPGGSQFRTPNYHDYTFVYDLSLTPSKALILFVTVQAEHDAHIFLGRPPGTPEVNLPAVGVHGFEIVIGGWKNGMSVIRRYPGQQELSRAYGARLNASERKEFWIYCSSNGTLLVGEGTNLFNRRFLGGERGQQVVDWQGNAIGSGVITVDAQLAGWLYPVDQVSIATGWGASGQWRLRLADGSGAPTIRSLANAGMDASQACCLCGGGSRGKKCDIEDWNNGPRTSVPTSSRRLNHGGAHSIKSFSGDLVLLGEASADGFLVRIPVAHTCAYDGPGWVDCYINAIIVPAAMAPRVVLPLSEVWTQIRSTSCRLRRFKLKRQAYSRWRASGCNFTAGSSYTLIMHVEPGTAVKQVEFTVPSPPANAPQSVSFIDDDPKPNFVAGPVLVQGRPDETDILQCRPWLPMM